MASMEEKELGKLLYRRVARLWPSLLAIYLSGAMLYLFLLQGRAGGLSSLAALHALIIYSTLVGAFALLLILILATFFYFFLRRLLKGKRDIERLARSALSKPADSDRDN